VQPDTNDYIGSYGFVLDNLTQQVPGQILYAPANATACWGTSLTNGTGAVSPAGGWPTKLGLVRTGQSISNLGVAGQTSSQILTRILRDTVRGKSTQCIFEMCRNDFLTPAQCLSDIAAAVATLTLA
jgi:lysophospholipase L1-like esterase